MARNCVPRSNIVSTVEIAQHFGENEMTVRQWLHRYPNRPEPITVVGAGQRPIRIYDLAEIRKWLAEYGPKKFRTPAEPS